MRKRLWEGWKRVAKKIARFNSKVLCLVLYYAMLPLVAVPYRLVKDTLRLKGNAPFIEREGSEASLEEASRQG
ncbi:MAG: hypothetical protein VCF07_14125 [Nitrospinota bacterium]